MQQDIDITEFDSVKACEQGHTFELLAGDGVTPTGVKLIVIGKHADVVRAYVNDVISEGVREATIAARKGKAPVPKTPDENRQAAIDWAASRVIGWFGVRQAFTADLLRNALRRNPHWIDQITEESDNLANFSTAQ